MLTFLMKVYTQYSLWYSVLETCNNKFRFSEKMAENEWRKFSKRGGITLTLGFIEGIMLYGIVCPTRAPETQVYVKHS